MQEWTNCVKGYCNFCGKFQSISITFEARYIAMPLRDVLIAFLPHPVPYTNECIFVGLLAENLNFFHQNFIQFGPPKWIKVRCGRMRESSNQFVRVCLCSGKGKVSTVRSNSLA